MLTQKIARQSIAETRLPPTIGPSAIAIPKTDPQAPIACARSRGSVKVLVMIESATGVSIEAPTACRARKATSRPTLGARLQSPEAAANMPRPRTKVRRRPKRSPTEPEKISMLASTTV